MKDAPKEVPQKKKAAKPGFADYRRLFRYSTKLERILMGLGLVASTANGFSFPIFGLVFGEMTDAFSPNATPDTVVDNARVQAIWFVIIGCISFLLSWIQMSTWMMAGDR